MGTFLGQLIKINILLLCLALLTISAHAGPSVLTYQGRIVNAVDNTPLEGSNVTFQFSIMSPDGTCTIFREQTGKDMTHSNGIFDLPIGEGTMSWPDNAHGGASFYATSSFDNGKNYACLENPSGTPYTPTVSDGRLLRVRFNDGSGLKTISPDSAIRSVPFASEATNASQLGGQIAANYVTKTTIPNCGSGSFLTYNNSSNTFGCASIGTILGSQVSGDISGKSAGFSGNLVGDVSGTQGATSVDQIKGVPVSATAPTSGQVLQYNGTKWAPASMGGGSLTAVTATAPVVSSGGTTPVISMHVADGSNDGYLSSADWTSFSGKVSKTAITTCNSHQTLVYNSGSDTSSCVTIDDNIKLPLAGGTMTGAINMGGQNILATGHITMSPQKTLNLGTYDNSTEATLTGSLGTADKGKIWYNTQASQMKYWDGAAAQVLGVAGAGLTSLNGETGSAQTFATSTSGTDFTISHASNIHTFNLPTASSSARGLLSSSDWTAFNSKLGASAAFSGDVSGTYTTTSVDKIKGKPVTLTSPVSGQVLQYNGTDFVNVTLTDNDSFAALPCGNGYVPFKSSGAWGCVAVASTSPAANSLVQTDGSSIAYAAGFTAKSGSAAVTIAPPASGVYTLTLPTSTGTNGQVLSSTGASGVLNWITPSTLDATKLPLAGGTMSGAINMGGNDITTSGNISFNAGKYLGLTATATPGSVAGQVWYDSGVIKYWNGSSAVTLGVSGAGLTSLDGETGSTQTFSTGSSGTDFNITHASNDHKFNFPDASASARGLLTSTDWSTFNSKLGTATAFSGDVSGAYNSTSVDKIKGKAVTLTTPTSGQVLQYNGTGFVNATLADSFAALPCADGYIPYHSSGAWTCIQASSTGAVANTLIQLDGSKIASAAGFNLTSGAASVTLAPPASGVYTLTLPTTVGTTGQVLTSTGAGGILSWTTPSTLDATKLPLAGGTMSGAINMGGNDITNSGNISFNAGKYLGLTATATPGSVAGQIWYDSGVIKYWNGSSAVSLGISGAGLTSLNGETGSTQTFATSTTGTDFTISHASNVHTFNFPDSSATSRGLLNSTDWSTFNSKLGTATAFSGDVSGAYNATSVDKLKGKALDTTLPSVTGQVYYWDNTAAKWKVTSAAAPNTNDVMKWNGTTWAPGTITAGWTAVDSAFGTKGIVAFDTDAATSGMVYTSSGIAKVNAGTGVNQIVKLDGSSRLPAVDGSQLTNLTAGSFSGSLVGDVSGTQGATSVDKIKGKAVTLTSPISGQVLQYNGTGFVNVTLTDNDSFAALPCGNGYVPLKSSGTWGCVVVASSTPTASALVQTDASSYIYAAGFVAKAGTAAVTLLPPASGVFSLTLPTSVGTSGQVLTSSGAGGVLNWTTPLSSSTGFVNGGNTFGAASSIGNTDSYDLTIKTNNAARVTVQAAGNVGVGTAAPADKLEVNGTIRTVASVANASTTIDWSKGNTQYSTVGCTGTQYTFSNMRDGGVYTLVITGTFSASCTFGQTSPDTLSGTPGSGNFYFLPANATATGSNSIYSFMRVGANVYVTWNSGFAN